MFVLAWPDIFPNYYLNFVYMYVVSLLVPNISQRYHLVSLCVLFDFPPDTPLKWHLIFVKMCVFFSLTLNVKVARFTNEAFTLFVSTHYVLYCQQHVLCTYCNFF